MSRTASSTETPSVASRTRQPAGWPRPTTTAAGGSTRTRCATTRGRWSWTSLVAGWLGQVQMLVFLGEYPEAELWARKALELFHTTAT